MAKLNSIKRQDFLDIQVHSFENENEDWIISKLFFSHKGEKLVNTIGSYFDLLELKLLIADIKKLLDKKVYAVRSLFLEPNLEIKINAIEDNKHRVDALFREYTYYRQEEIGNKSDRKLIFTTNKTILANFIKELESELQYLENTRAKN